jgi:hypothetical protein
MPRNSIRPAITPQSLSVVWPRVTHFAREPVEMYDGEEVNARTAPWELWHHDAARTGNGRLYHRSRRWEPTILASSRQEETTPSAGRSRERRAEAHGRGGRGERRGRGSKPTSPADTTAREERVKMRMRGGGCRVAHRDHERGASGDETDRSTLTTCRCRPARAGKERALGGPDQDEWRAQGAVVGWWPWRADAEQLSFIEDERRPGREELDAGCSQASL